MHTSSIFSCTRFGRYLRLYLTQHGRLFGYSILGAYLLFTLLLTFFASTEYYSTQSIASARTLRNIINMTVGFSVMPLFPIAAIVGSHLMHSISNKRNRLNTLTLPATSLEKYFSYWLIHILFFFVAYIFVIIAADLTRTVLCSMFYPNIINIQRVTGQQFLKEFPSKLLPIVTMSCLLIQSYFILGSTIWRRYSFFKTLGVVLALTGITVIAIALITDQFVPNNSSNINFEGIANSWIYIATIPIVFNWVMAYFRFKETELIHHV